MSEAMFELMAANALLRELIAQDDIARTCLAGALAELSTENARLKEALTFVMKLAGVDYVVLP